MNFLKSSNDTNGAFLGISTRGLDSILEAFERGTGKAKHEHGWSILTSDTI